MRNNEKGKVGWIFTLSIGPPAAIDHDFEAETTLKLFGIHAPMIDENYLYFTESNVTADLHSIVINADDGSENSSRRTQFIKRIVEFAESKSIDISLTYYPSYHSKYNPLKRVWGILEKHWRGELLESVDKVIGLSRTMKWKGIDPIVNVMDKIYETGIRLSKSAMKKYENMLTRLSGLENWLDSNLGQVQ